MTTLSPIRACWLAFLCQCTLSHAGPFIAGSTPDRRPADAPVITQHVVEPSTLQRHLRGVVAPAPANVVDAVRSGPWFMPLRSPGMTPPYDIRGWFPAAPK